MITEETEEEGKYHIQTRVGPTQIEVLSENTNKSIVNHRAPVKQQMLQVPSNSFEASGCNESSKSRSSSVVSSISAAEAMESDDESPRECPEGAFTFDDKTTGVTTESTRTTSGGNECVQAPPEKIELPLDDDVRSQSGLSSCVDTEDELLPDDSRRKDTKRLGKRQGSWGIIRHIVFWSPFVQEYKRSYPWVQLAGHEGSFKPGEGGTILKKACSKEKECLTRLMRDVLRPYVPEFYGQVEDKEKGEKYLRMQDLLANFVDPAVMDIKMGVRTYMEDELLKAREKPGYRTDLYEKMVKIDPSAPTEEEQKQRAITKARYMQWRETITTTSRYGYRIEAIKLPGGDKPHMKEFRNMKDPVDVSHWLSIFSGGNSDVQATILARLRDMRMTLETSPFFRKHALIGSSLLFVRDRSDHTGVWMIDFGKTTMMPDNCLLDHRSPWVEGNHEDGYLWGLDNLICLWECMK